MDLTKYSATTELVGYEFSLIEETYNKLISQGWEEYNRNNTHVQSKIDSWHPVISIELGFPIIEQCEYYGEKHAKYCPNCNKELEANKASDVHFGDNSTDVIRVFCDKCYYEEAIFSY